MSPPPTTDDGLQAERTTMSWVRTAVALEGTVVLATRALHDQTGAVVILLVTTLGVATFMLGVLPGLHRRRTATMAGGGSRIPPALTVAGLVVTVCLATATMIVVDDTGR